ncbi:uncharacterized protein LOC116290137 [Actinia tenebrosa]|uniref:Uncharacterized protein LOC116290137 n=1 Tax=Actinia tenebrosa TaxID=6105 RepID=A0A6P8HJX3_ACTTE|nr:uncharacterized protein LOC116290137 [Actinia tenebrosa]
MLHSVSKYVGFLLLPLIFAVCVAAGTEVCGLVQEASKKVCVDSGGVASLKWGVTQPVDMLRMCVQLKDRENYENGVCPPGFQPFFALSDTVLKLLGKDELKPALDQFAFVGNLSNGKLWFHINVTGAFAGKWTFLALVKFQGDPVAKCHRNLTSYYLAVEDTNLTTGYLCGPPTKTSGHSPTKKNTTLTTGYPRGPTTKMSGHSPTKKNGLSLKIIAIVLGCLFFLVLVLVVVIFANCYKIHQQSSRGNGIGQCKSYLV